MQHIPLNIKKLSLLIGDVVVLYASLYFTLFVRYGEAPSQILWQQHLWPFSAIFAIWLIIFYISDLYNLITATNNSKFYALTTEALFVNFLIGTAFFYLIPNLAITPKRNLFIVVVITTILFLIWRQLFNITLKSLLPKQNIAIIGLNSQVRELIKYFNDHPHLGFRIAFILFDKEYDEQGTFNIKIYKDIKNIKKYVKQERINTIVLAGNLQRTNELRSCLFSCLALRVEFITLFNFYSKTLGKISLHSVNQMWFMENLNRGGILWFDKFKRTYDIILAIVIFITTLPFWPLIALFIKIGSKGPMLYKQERIGKNNETFNLIKFRSMIEGDNNRQPTVHNDARVTRFGRFIRRTRIDELPQVINIIKGDMSFIGPRPERPELVQKLQEEIPFYNERTLVVPGVTGWDQVCGEYHSPTLDDTLKKLQYDLYYIKNRSLFMDLIIILKTLRTILMGGGV
ncbi:MAG: sugar transferase [Candidatus Falkowbacteria bacterium]